MVEEISPFQFTPQPPLEFFKSRDNKDMLMQWNLDVSLQVECFHCAGHFSATAAGEYERLLKDLFKTTEVNSLLHFSGTPSVPMTVDMEQLDHSVLSMEFFDKLVDVVAPTGTIRGCFEEVYDGITVGDLLRDFFINDGTENASLYTEDERKQFIFHLLRLFVVGGTMCQPDSKMERYLEATKSLYKEILTVYRDSKTNEIAVSGRVYEVKAVSGLTLFSHSAKLHNHIYVLVDPLKHRVVVLKLDLKSFW